MPNKPPQADLEKPIRKAAKTPVAKQAETVARPVKKTTKAKRTQRPVQDVQPTPVEAKIKPVNPDVEAKAAKKAWPSPENGVDQPRPHYDTAPNLKIRNSNDKNTVTPTEAVSVDGAKFDLVASTERLDPHPLMSHKRDTVFKDRARATGHANLVDTPEEQERGRLAAKAEEVLDAGYAHLISPQAAGRTSLADRAALAKKVLA